jgi:hypothetical protein
VKPTLAEPITTIVKFNATTDVSGVNSTQVDQGVIEAFKNMTGETLGVDADAVNVTSVSDIVTRRARHLVGLGSSHRALDSAGVRIAFTILVILEQTPYSSPTVAVTTYDSLLTTKFTAGSTGSQLVALAVSKGSTSVTSSTVISLTAPVVNYNYVLIVVQTGAPSSAPTAAIVEPRGSGGGGSSTDMTPIIIGVAVGGAALLIILVAAYFYCGGGKYASKIEPR